MKRLLSLTVLMVLVSSGCVVDSGDDHDPTRPGYFLFSLANTQLHQSMDQVWPVFAFAQYYAATSDEERERLHDSYFYSQRITHNGNEWRIIDSQRELVIDTGGKQIDDPEAEWSYSYTDISYASNVPPSIRHIGNSEYRLTLPATRQKFSLQGEFLLRPTFGQAPGNGTHFIEIVFSGTGECQADDLTISIDITEPIRYSTSKPFCDEGSMTLSIRNNEKIDTAEASYLLPGEVQIKYSGYEKNWIIGSWI